MLHRVMTLVRSPLVAVVAFGFAPACDYSPPDTPAPELDRLGLSVEDAPVVVTTTVDPVEAVTVTRIETPKPSDSPSKSASKEIQTYALERHLLVSALPVTRPMPAPCPPDQLTVTVDDGTDVLDEATLTVGERGGTVELVLPCAPGRCDEALGLTITRTSGGPALTVTVYELP